MDEKIQAKDGAGDGEGGESQRPRPVKKIAVNLVRREGKAALVEWKRGRKVVHTIVPVEAVIDEKVLETDLEAGLPFGEDWTQVDGVTEELAKALHDIDIWTKEDLLARSHLVRDAVIKTYVPPVTRALIEHAKKED